MKTFTVHLIRHGLTNGNVEGKYIGHTDEPLSEDGINQIISMKNEYVYPGADVVFSSPLKRAVDTAKLIYPDNKIVTIDGFIEYNFGEFEGRDADYLHEKQELFDSWLRGDKGVAPPFGESNEEFAKRVCTSFIAVIEGIMRSGYESAVIVTHGGVIMTLMANFALPEAPVHDWLTPPACGYTLRLDDTIWHKGHKLEAVEEIPLLPEEKRNYYDGWDYYPEPDLDDFDVSEYLYD